MVARIHATRETNAEGAWLDDSDAGKGNDTKNDGKR
jgi:hypothetical protein